MSGRQEFGTAPVLPGELYYLATDANETPGRRITALRKVPLRLEMIACDDVRVLREQGLAAMRRRRLGRLARQALAQGGLLTIADQADLVSSSEATVKRDLATCRAHGEATPTRGQIQEIGSGIAHRVRLVELYLSGLDSDEIEQRSGYSSDACQRHLSEFGQVITLHIGNHGIGEIRDRSAISTALITSFIRLYESHRANPESLIRLLALGGLSS